MLTPILFVNPRCCIMVNRIRFFTQQVSAPYMDQNTEGNILQLLAILLWFQNQALPFFIFLANYFDLFFIHPPSLSKAALIP